MTTGRPVSPTPLLGPAAVELAREALAEFTVDGVAERLGPRGAACLAAGDTAGVSRALGGEDDSVATLVRLFLLAEAVPAAAARAALRPLSAEAAAGLVAADGGDVRARVEVRPHAVTGGPPWWTVSDFGTDVRPGPLRPDHVLGIGGASVSLAQAVVRRPVEVALDLGTGCGVQALHLSTHAARVVATDTNPRALRHAATTAALSDVALDLREGSLLDPVRDERFGCVVANPPFVVSPGLDAGSGGYEYRDSGRPGDGVTEHLVRRVPDVLAPGGVAALLANWTIRPGQAWEDRLAGWLAGTGCDAWVWRRETLDPASYVSLWLRDAGEIPGSVRWRAQYDAWCDWFDREAISAVGMGLVSLHRVERVTPVVVCEDVPQAVEQPIGPAIGAWFERVDWLERRRPDALLTARLRAADVERVDVQRLAGDGWQTATRALRQPGGVRWEVEADEAVSALVAGCGGELPLAAGVSVLAAAFGLDETTVWGALEPVVRDLVRRGFLLPEDDAPGL